MHDTHLIVTVAVGLVLAFTLGFIAVRLRLPPLVGYLLAGVAIGPLAPGAEADVIAGQLSEIGVILLMFGVGLHFSGSDLLAVRGIAIPGALIQIVLATAIGAGVGLLFGWELGAALVFGLALSVASTVVLLRALDQRNALESANGRIAVGWLIVEDLAMVFALVFIPTLAGIFGGGAGAVDDGHGGTVTGNLFLTILFTLAKVGAFVALVLLLGPKVVPWILSQVARAGSRELFTLSVLAIALGIAVGAAEVFGVSIALGAFLAGLVLNESEFSHKAATDSLPLQDAFAVLFFFSIGMLFDPMVLINDPLAVLAVLAVILVGKSIGAILIVALLRFPVSTGLFAAAGLAQIGEFSFILAGLGVMLGLMPPEARDLIVAGALVSIMINPLMFALTEPVGAWIRSMPWLASRLEAGGVTKLAALERKFQDARKEAEERAAARVGTLTKDLINRFPMFTGLNPEQREELLALFRPRSASPGERLIRVGDRPDMAYFISSGAVEVTIGDKRIHLGPGEIFGEMALLSGSRRSADVTAIDYSQFLTLDQWDFRQFVAKYPDLGARLNEVAAQRESMNRGEPSPPAPPSPPAANAESEVALVEPAPSTAPPS